MPSSNKETYIAKSIIKKYINDRYNKIQATSATNDDTKLYLIGRQSELNKLNEFLDTVA